MAAADAPDYTLNEHEDNYVRVRVFIPNLKAKKKGFMSKITGGGRKDQAKNAQIECDFQDRSFALTVTGDSVKGMENKVWTLSSSTLPHSIDPSTSYWQTEDGCVAVFLRKACTADDWGSIVRKGEL